MFKNYNNNLFLQQEGLEKRNNYKIPLLKYKFEVSFVARGVKEYSARFQQIISILNLLGIFTLPLSSLDIIDKIYKTKKGKVKNSEILLIYKLLWLNQNSNLINFENFFSILEQFFLYNSSSFLVNYEKKTSSLILTFSNFNTLFDLFKLDNKNKKLNNLVSTDYLKLKITPIIKDKSLISFVSIFNKKFNKLDLQ